MRRALKDAKEVAHYWANKVQSEGYCGNMRFDGPKIYSYAECIAVIHEREGKQPMVLRTVRDWSMTTMKHKGYVGGAARHMQVLDVIVFENPSGKSDHITNLKYLLGQYSKAMENAAKARTRGDMYREEALRHANDYNRYAEFFGLKERFDEGAAKRLEKQVKAEEAKLEKKRKAAEAKRVEELKDHLAEWRQGGDRDLWSLPFIALRLGKSRGAHRTGGLLPDRGSEGKEVIETSRGAEIPVTEAKRLWPIIQRTMRGEREYEVGMQLGDYQLTKIRKDGSIVVGCHDIPFTEIEGIAHQLGLTNTSEAQRAFDGLKAE